MKNLFFLSGLICVIINSADAQPGPSQKLTAEQIHRIGDYGKLWCVLKLFHPEMAYNVINADSLFTDNISGLLNDPSAANFKAAVQKMIDRLHDPYTTIKQKTTAKDSVKLPDRPLLKWIEDSTALIYFSDEFMRENFSDFSSAGLMQLVDSIKNAPGIIVDIRRTNPVNPNDDYAPLFIKQFIGYVASHSINYPSFRTRIHYGHESETFNSSFYYQGWFLQNSSSVNTKQKAIQKPICLLINRFNNNISDAIAAMQQERIASVIAEDSLGDFEPAFVYPMQLTDSVNVNVRLSEVIYSNGNKAFSPDVIVYPINIKTGDTLIHTAIQLFKSKNERKFAAAPQVQNTFVTSKVADYDSLAYPPAPLRLLGLMRYWSAIQYFCANKDLIAKNWDSVLYEYVPKFFNAKDSFDYVFAAARLITEIHDGHGWLSSRVFSSLRAKAPEVQLKYVENKTIVYKVFGDSLKKDIFPGDEITSVDGIPVKKLRDSIGQYIGASNDAALQRDITHYLLAGKENTYAKINLLHEGKPTVTSLFRNKNWWEVAFAPDEGAVWKKLDDKLGYVDFGRLEVQQIDSMFNDLKETDAIILDDRSYPRGTVWSLVSYLTDKTVYGARGITMIADSPDPLTVTTQEQFWPIPVTPNPLQYKGRIIILVNEITQSQAEYSCMVLQAAYKDVTIIGSQTAGADGDVTGIKLPGGIQTAFSGHGVHYPDGRLTQGIGIVPDIKILPTIKGIKEGRDEVLERAIEFAKKGQ
jgi:C-terminal processing protease CtpA/Prc